MKLSKRVFFWAVLTILLVATLTSVLDIQPVTCATITVPDDYPTIQAAIDHASDLATIHVRNGTYHENVNVTRSVNLIGENPATTEIQGSVTVTGTLGYGHTSIINFTINSDSVGVRVETSANAIGECNIVSNGPGVVLNASSDSSVLSCHISAVLFGVWLSESSNCLISDNNITGPVGGGIYLSMTSTANRICQNTIVGAAAAIMIQDSSYNYAYSNNITSSRNVGIGISGSSYIDVHENNLTANAIGIQLTSSNHVTIFHNNLITNQVEAIADDASLNNGWSYGYSDGGNYWSSYAGIDVKSGPSQDEPDCDGIGDTPFTVNTNSQDRWPLMNPWGIGSRQNDLSLVGISPIQVVEDPKALVANKPSVFRINVRSTFSKQVRVEIKVYYDFKTRSYLEKGPAQKGIPINPGLNRIYIPGGPVYDEHGTVQSAWSFDPVGLNWSQKGIDPFIKVVVDPSNKIQETNKLNNWDSTGVLTPTVKITESEKLRIAVIPVYFPALGQHKYSVHGMKAQREFMLANYPIAPDKLHWISYWLPMAIPGTPDLSSSNALDKWLYENVAKRVTDQVKLFPYDRIVIVIPDVGQNWLGWAPRGLTPSPVFVREDYLTSDEGLVAHEIGHTYSLCHPEHQGPAISDTKRFWVSKRDFERIGPNLMAWAGPTGWIDKQRYDTDNALVTYKGHTYERRNLYDQLNIDPEPSEVVLIGGTISENGTIDVDRTWYRLANRYPDPLNGTTGNYSIVLLDDARQLIGQMGFNATFNFLNLECDPPAVICMDSVPFIFRISYVSGTSMIEIRNASGHVLVSRSLSANAPSTTVTFPNGDETVVGGTNCTVTWQSSDLDGDQLTHSVAYSPNGGEDWISVAFEISDQSCVWDTSQLTAGGNYLIKVTTSDGVNTCEAISNKTFTVLTHDTAIEDVLAASTIVGQGYPTEINVTASNVGTYPETFNVTIYANATAVASQTVNLGSATSKTVTFMWDATTIPKGSYTMSAYALPVENETRTDDNALDNGLVSVTIPGDLNGDFTVDIYDAIILAGAFDCKLGDLNWDANADINGDTTVDIYDAIILSNHYDQHYP